MSNINFEDIQANILLGHGKKYMRCLFLSFEKDQKRIRAFISNHIYPKVTNAKVQIDDFVKHTEKQALTNRMVITFSISRFGYKKLRTGQRNWPRDASFVAGMKSKKVNKKLSDKKTNYWEEGFRQNIDAVILIAHNDLPEIYAQINAFRDLLKDDGNGQKVGKVLFVEKGEKKKIDGQVVEHFGYKDGISQPLFIGPNGQLNDQVWQQVLNQEKKGRYGSFLVFRKLEQHVKKFNKSIHHFSNIHGLSPEMLGAQLVGRFKDGTPLTLADKPGLPVQEHNDFDYQNDTKGAKCPFHAHIRKANPRGFGDAKKVVIARRGITYEKWRQDDEDRNYDQGLLFMSYQRSIVNQFEFIQAEWMNDADFPSDKAPVGSDPVAGSPKDQNQKWNKSYNKPQGGNLFFNMNKFVTLKGGEYFYTPSISFLRYLIKGSGHKQPKAPKHIGPAPGLPDNNGGYGKKLFIFNRSFRYA